MSYVGQDHRGEYAEVGHDHYDYAERHHRHYGDESTVQGLRQDLSAAEARICGFEDGLRGALDRIRALEDDGAEDTRRLGGVRALLARFDWELDDRQYALEAIERIVEGESDAG